MDQEKIGKFIAACRKEKGLTQAQIAEQFGISNRAVSKWENGKSLPDAANMIGLCNLLGITVNELLTGERINGIDYKEKAEENLIEMKRWFEIGNEYARLSNWKDIALIKFCLCAIGVIIGVLVAPEYKKPVLLTAAAVFLVTYIPLMAKTFKVAKKVFKKE